MHSSAVKLLANGEIETKVLHQSGKATIKLCARTMFMVNKILPIDVADKGVDRRLHFYRFKSEFVADPDPAKPFQFKNDPLNIDGLSDVSLNAVVIAVLQVCQLHYHLVNSQVGGFPIPAGTVFHGLAYNNLSYFRNIVDFMNGAFVVTESKLDKVLLEDFKQCFINGYLHFQISSDVAFVDLIKLLVPTVSFAKVTKTKSVYLTNVKCRPEFPFWNAVPNMDVHSYQRLLSLNQHVSETANAVEDVRKETTDFFDGIEEIADEGVMQAMADCALAENN